MTATNKVKFDFIRMRKNKEYCYNCETKNHIIVCLGTVIFVLVLWVYLLEKGYLTPLHILLRG